MGITSQASSNSSGPSPVSDTLPSTPAGLLPSSTPNGSTPTPISSIGGGGGGGGGQGNGANGNNGGITLNHPPPSVSASPPGKPCCESGRLSITHPLTGQKICSCQYDAHLLNYQRLAASAGLPLGIYNPAAAAAAVYGAAAAGGGGGGGLPPENSPFIPGLGPEQSPFYPGPPGSGLDLKENMEAWRTIPYATAASMYGCYDGGVLTGYPFGPNGYGMDLNGARRKNATRETTSTLKAWLNDHRKNPYPTKGEKIMLAIITKMTLTQVSTWFANARRRLKKENKMTWSPRNRCDDEDGPDDDGKESSGVNESFTSGGESRDLDGRDGNHHSNGYGKNNCKDDADSDIVDIEEDSSSDNIIDKKRFKHNESPLSDSGGSGVTISASGVTLGGDLHPSHHPHLHHLPLSQHHPLLHHHHPSHPHHPLHSLHHPAHHLPTSGIPRSKLDIISASIPPPPSTLSSSTSSLSLTTNTITSNGNTNTTSSNNNNNNRDRDSESTANHMRSHHGLHPHTLPPSKPRIWSIVDTATSNNNNTTTTTGNNSPVNNSTTTTTTTTAIPANTTYHFNL